jgi:hypothetical protein
METFTSQDSGDKFGPISDSQFRVDSPINVSVSAKAYAFCDAQILVQNSPSGNLNIVLKPIVQPILNIGRIDYIIYRGVDASSLVDSANVADRTFNDLNEKIWSNQEQTDTNNSTGPNNPSIDALGVSYSATGVGDFLVLDTESIESVFLKSDEIQLVTVQAGDKIGDFVGGVTKAGFEIVMERLGSIATMDIARLDEHILTMATTLGTTNAEKFDHYNEKEQILNYADPAAFFGMCHYGDDNLIIPSTVSAVFSIVDLVKKFQNRNRIYLDLRSEYDYSFNYFTNYDEDIAITLDVTTPPVTLPLVNFYTGNLTPATGYGTWPIFIIESQTVVDLTGDSLGGKLLLELKDPNSCLSGSYFIEARTNNKKTTPFNFKDGGLTIELSSWIYDNAGQNVFGTGYILAKTFYDRQSSYLGLFKPSTSAIDHLFPINKLNLSFEKDPDDVIMKIFNNGGVVQHLEYPEYFSETYASFLGIAKDSHSYTFFTYPNEDFGHKKDSKMSSNFTPITSRLKGEKDFFNTIHKSVQNISFETRDIEYSTIMVPTIKAVRNAENSIGENFEPNYLNAIQITHAEYAAVLVAISSSDLLQQYSIYLSTKGDQSRIQELPGFQFRSTQLIVSGLRFVPGSLDAELESQTVDTGIYIQTIISKD